MDADDHRERVIEGSQTNEARLRRADPAPGICTWGPRTARYLRARVAHVATEWRLQGETTWGWDLSEEAARSLGTEFLKGAVLGGGPSGLAGAYWWENSEKTCAVPGRIPCYENVEVLGIPFYSPVALGGVCALFGLLIVGAYLAYLAYRKNERNRLNPPA